MSYIYVPLYETLAIKHIFKKIREYPEVLDYLPDVQDWGRLPRQFICNIAHTIIGKPFAQWVMEADNDRNQVVAAKQDCMIHMDPEIAKAFEASTAISSKSTTLPRSQRAPSHIQHD